MESFAYHNPTVLDFGKDKRKTNWSTLSYSRRKKVLVTFGSDRIKKMVYLML